MADPGELLLVERVDRELGAGVGVIADLLELLGGERAGLAEHVFVDAELADVVQERGLREPDRPVAVPAARERELLGEAGDPLGVAFGAGILGVELARERAEAADAAVIGESPARRRCGVELAAPAEGDVAAGALGVGERDLGEGEQLVGAGHILEVADAGRGGDDADALDRGGGEGAAGTLGGDPAVQALGLGEDPAEVVGGEPGDELAVPDGGGEAAADLGENTVAGKAAMLGVDPAEAVDVDEHEREGALVPVGAARLGAELLVEGAVVGQVRQMVARRERAQLGARICECDRRLRSERELCETCCVCALRHDRAPDAGADAHRHSARRRPAGREDGGHAGRRRP